ncbi:trypco2 family protein [Actinoplanes auranticolor]|uniref:Trypsin-co-occurring domain-containing protein n=1 Tax=Actinoplanes auranticolor TaxID=47988 RepID=A0A919S351_9ACTN|nr:trypco2 family protein [Actinoplanes auranticolor]GIM63017.1 hypothetical protein Aau02nite_01320 [Actinoplanes auranticolor]
METSGELTVAEALASLREQLIDAVERSEGEDMRFVCTSVDVELQVSVTSVRKGEAKAGLWSVVTVGGGVDHSNASVHKIKLTLVPEFQGRRGVKVADQGKR